MSSIPKGGFIITVSYSIPNELKYHWMIQFTIVRNECLHIGLQEVHIVDIELLRVDPGDIQGCLIHLDSQREGSSRQNSPDAEYARPDTEV